MFLHGWPESWYSWRHQLSALQHQKRYVGCAPDMRGYGLTDAPKDVESYNIHTLCKDVIEIARALGYDKFIIVGHDFGSYLAWRIAAFYPRHVIGLCGMSVPYMGLQSPKKRGPIADLRRSYDNGNKFHYMLYHQLPMAAEEYRKNAHQTLYRLYGALPNMDTQSIVEGTPEVTNPNMFPHNSSNANTHLDARQAPGVWKRLPQPKQLPTWVSQSDIQYLTLEYERRGFHGGLNWYRALDKNWQVTTLFEKQQDFVMIYPPCLFMGGEKDAVIKAHGGALLIQDRMKVLCKNLTKAVILKGAGHWIQMECASEVNQELFSFLDSLSLEDYEMGNFIPQSKL